MLYLFRTEDHYCLFGEVDQWSILTRLTKLCPQVFLQSHNGETNWNLSVQALGVCQFVEEALVLPRREAERDQKISLGWLNAKTREWQSCLIQVNAWLATMILPIHDQAPDVKAERENIGLQEIEPQDRAFRAKDSEFRL